MHFSSFLLTILFAFCYQVRAYDTIGLSRFLTEHSFAFQGANGDVSESGLVWAKACSSPWNAVYAFRCVRHNQIMFETKIRKKVSHFNFQGPKIRISRGSKNMCVQILGRLHIFRSRNGGAFKNITSTVKDFNGKRPYDGQDAIFWDVSDMDC